ncbi:response regulator [Salinarimonas sp.]|uniref:response regulator n=1 Tax=Salinarimonas sp. TaxID=2766526 RepID=UPI0032D8D8D3
MTSAVEGKRVLLLEDEFIVALAAEDMLVELGAVVIGPAATVAEGLALADAPLDAAVLDVNMNGERSFAVARALRARGVPFVFATGYAEVDGGEVVDAPIVPKPYTADDLAAALCRVLAGCPRP